MLFLNHNNPIITVELIDTNESENDSDEDEEEEKKCPNVVGLDYWNEFLKSNGIDDVSDHEHFTDLIKNIIYVEQIDCLNEGNFATRDWFFKSKFASPVVNGTKYES
jgi:hypothetical protein